MDPELEKKLKELQTEIRAKREARQALEKEASAGKPADQAARRKRLDESQQEIAQLERVFNALAELLESTALDLTGPPTVQRVEAPKSTKMP
jgi:ferritin-like metal-binding protein YciE